MSAGRQLVDGVAGTRPGGRGAARPPKLRLDHLGRWVEDKLDWLLEDDESWPETWEASAPVRRRGLAASAAAEPAAPLPPQRRQPLEAISRRGRQPQAGDPQDWPEDDSFSVNRWRRSDNDRRPDSPPEAQAERRSSPGRAVPRSSRRRID